MNPASLVVRGVCDEAERSRGTATRKYEGPWLAEAALVDLLLLRVSGECVRVE